MAIRYQVEVSGKLATSLEAVARRCTEADERSKGANTLTAR